jgi:glycosyltransferase involved in cell wall biosynthesis
MPTQILELDIAAITPILFEEAYDRYRALVRSQKQPVGWINFQTNKTGSISPRQIQQKIKVQMGYSVVPPALVHAFALPEKNVIPEEGISIVVCTRNRTAQLSTCLNTLLALDYSNYEIIIVDNAPSDNATHDITAALPVRYVREDRPGLDWARNRGIKEARYDIIAFTDDDVRVDPYWLQSIAKTFFNKEVMGASGYVAPAELETKPQQVFELQYGGMGHGFKRRVLSKKTLSTKQLLWASNFGIGANMAFRKEVFQKIGDFDTALDVGTPSHGGGDVEMFHRLVRKGHLFVYEPSMLIWHYHRRDEKALRKQIFDNGRSFGCYLIDCFLKKTINRVSIVKFFVVDWLWKWNLKNLLGRRTKIPRELSAMELYGMLTSPFAYWKTKAHNRKISRR